MCVPPATARPHVTRRRLMEQPYQLFLLPRRSTTGAPPHWHTALHVHCLAHALRGDEPTLSLLVDVVENVGAVHRSFLICKPEILILLQKHHSGTKVWTTRNAKIFRDEDVIASPKGHRLLLHQRIIYPVSHCEFFFAITQYISDTHNARCHFFIS